jgi:hypothetical protein
MTLPRRIRSLWGFIEASATKHGLDPYLLAAVVDRESLGGHLLNEEGLGDNGHGHGLMQIDDRSHADFLAELMPDGTPAWKDPASNIDKGAQILARSMDHFENLAKRYTCVVGAVQIAGIGGYNASAPRIFKALDELTLPSTYEARLEAVDLCTTGHNYVSDVLRKRQEFMQIAPEKSPPPPPRPK